MEPGSEATTVSGPCAGRLAEGGALFRLEVDSDGTLGCPESSSDVVPLAESRWSVHILLSLSPPPQAERARDSNAHAGMRVNLEVFMIVLLQFEKD